MRNVFAENCIHAALGTALPAVDSVLSELGQGDRYAPLRSVWSFVEPKAGREGAERRVLDTVAVLNFVVPFSRVTHWGHSLKAANDQDYLLDLFAYFIERVKFMEAA